MQTFAALSPVMGGSTHHERAVNHVTMSQDMLLRATGDVRMMIEVREGDDVLWSKWVGSHDAKVRVTQRIRAVEFSCDGSLLFVGAADRLWAFDARNGDVLWDYVPPRSLGFLIVSPISISVSASGELAVSFDNGRIRFLKADGSLIGQWKDVDVQQHIALLRDDIRMVGCDTGVNVFDLYQRKRISRVRLPERSISMGVGGPTDQVAVRTLHELVVVDVERGEVISTMPTRVGIPLVAFHPTLPMIAVSEEFAVTLVDPECKVLRRIEVDTHSPEVVFEELADEPRPKVLALMFTPDGEALAVGCSDGTVRSFALD